eukprot:1066687-Lingulodinium_polyedra.AAC.1
MRGPLRALTNGEQWRRARTGGPTTAPLRTSWMSPGAFFKSWWVGVGPGSIRASTRWPRPRAPLPSPSTSSG